MASLERAARMMPETCDANASLVAAAPAMLIALEKTEAMMALLMKAIGPVIGKTFDFPFAELNEASLARTAALAKARGGK